MALTHAQGFDRSRAWLRGPDFFRRFRPRGAGVPLRNARLGKDTELIIAERAGARIAFVARELSEPHMAQGTLSGIPYLVSF